MVVVAYGQKIPAELLSWPPHGVVNVHGSILPKYRGAAPIQYALIMGEKQTGVTTMLMDEGLGHRRYTAAASRRHRTGRECRRTERKARYFRGKTSCPHAERPRSRLYKPDPSG